MALPEALNTVVAYPPLSPRIAVRLERNVRASLEQITDAVSVEFTNTNLYCNTVHITLYHI